MSLIINPYRFGSGGGDPYFANVSSLLHLDGAGTTIVDVKGKTWAATGNATQSALQSRFGAASLLLDGDGDDIRTAAHADFGFGAGDFTVEGWFRRTGTNTNAFLADFRVAAGDSLVIWCSQSAFADCLGYSTEIGTGFLHGAAGEFTLNTWLHWAVCRSGTDVSGYVHGSRVFTGTDSRTFASPQGVYLGSSTAANQGATGNIDEVRITKGVARYTGATYTVPTAAFPDS